MDVQSWLAPSGEGSQFEEMSSQTMRVQAKRLAAYLPMTAVRQILEGTLPPPGTAVWLNAATLFSDISGFTHMAETLAAEGPRGAEELNRVLLMTFTALINIIHEAGGTVVHFHGDAMLVYFPDEDGRAAKRALACAGFMQSLMKKNLAQISIDQPTKKTVHFVLGIKIGVSYGRCCQIVVGDAAENLEFVLGGQPVDEAVSAQQQAAADQVVAAKSILDQAGLPTEEEFCVVGESVPVPHAGESLHWHAYGPDALKRLLRIGPAFVPSALVDRLQSQTALFIAGHRSVTSLFVQFEGIDYSYEMVGQQLQSYYNWATGVVARFGRQNGRVNRVLTGDKGNQIHILFGAPVAPDAPDQAVRCALALQREKPDFIDAQRIGLAAGSVFATAVGSQSRREYTTVGSMINLSAHLTQICPPGRIVVNEQTARRVWHQFEFDRLPTVNLKGHQQPTAVYSVVDEPLNQGQFAARFARWQKPPLGRDRERAQLAERLEMALAGKGGLVALTGSFGGGIRQLLAEGVRQWLAAGGRGLAGVCQPHLTDVPYAPWQSIWRDLFGLNNKMSLEVQAMLVEDSVRSLIPNWADEVSLWLAAMGLPPPKNAVTAVATSVRQIWLFTLIQRYLVQSAKGQPLLILLEDVHWADQTSLDLVTELAAGLADLPLLLVITFRPTEEFHLPILNHTECTTIALADWSVEQARDVMRRRLGTQEVPLIVEQRLGLRDQHGREMKTVNPLFLEESLKIMLSLDVLQYAGEVDGRVTVNETRLAHMQVPDTIATLLQARLDNIPALAYSLLQVASVIGREFDLELLLNIDQQLTWAEAQDQIGILVDAELIQPISADLQAVYIFQHALLHEVVYQSLPYARRQGIHLAVAARLQAQYEHNLSPINALLAHHYKQASQPEAGFKFALAAADEAAEMFANRSAIDLYQQALFHLQEMGMEGHWGTAVKNLLAQANAHQLLGEYLQAETAVLAAESVAVEGGVDLAFISIDISLAEIRLAQGRLEEAWALARKRVGGKAISSPAFELARAFQVLGAVAMARFDLKQADGNLRQARLILQKEELNELMSDVLAELGRVRFWLQSAERALSLCRQAVELAQQSRHPVAVGKTMLALSEVTFLNGSNDESLRAADAAVEVVRMTSPGLLATLYLQRTKLYLYDGRYDRALSNLQRASELYAKMEDVLGSLRLYLLWGGGYCIRLEEWEEAFHWLDKARMQLAKLTQAGGTAVLESVQLRLGLAQIAIHTKQWEQAKTLLQEADNEITAVNMKWWLPELLYWQGKLELAKNNAGEAEKYFLTALDALSKGGDPDLLPLVLLNLSKMVPKTDDRKWQYLEKCVAAAKNRAYAGDRANCLQEAGYALTQAPDPRLMQIGAACLAEISEQSNSQ